MNENLIIKDVRHLPLFECIAKDQDDDKLDQDFFNTLPFFRLISTFHSILPDSNEEGLRTEMAQELLTSWWSINEGLKTCAYLGTDNVAKFLIKEALWCKTKEQLDPILDFENNRWKKTDNDLNFLNQYLHLYFTLEIDNQGISKKERVKYFWNWPGYPPLSTADAAEIGDLRALAALHRSFMAVEANTCSNAAKHGHLDCLKYAHENGGIWGSYTCSSAAEGGYLDCLRYAHENGCEWGYLTCQFAASCGHMDCLRYAHENGCPWDRNSICNYAATSGKLDCLKYAHTNGCHLDNSRVCAYASLMGHLDCLIYAHENGCEWDSSTCWYAASNGQLDCLKYAHENGCPWNSLTCFFALTNGHLECLKYAKDHGCEISLITNLEVAMETGQKSDEV